MVATVSISARDESDGLQSSHEALLEVTPVPSDALFVVPGDEIPVDMDSGFLKCVGPLLPQPAAAGGAVRAGGSLSCSVRLPTYAARAYRLSNRGHGTQLVDGKLLATTCGIVVRINKLVTVRPLKSRRAQLQQPAAAAGQPTRPRCRCASGVAATAVHVDSPPRPDETLRSLCRYTAETGDVVVGRVTEARVRSRPRVCGPTTYTHAPKRAPARRQAASG